MGRQKSIDRDRLLDLSEEIVRTQGAGALTIDALAKAAGITKGGVQYTFASKAALIEAICARWMESYEAIYSGLVTPDAVATDRIRAHADATFLDEEPAQAKAASMMVIMLQSPEFMSATREWYQARLRGLDATTDEGRKARLAFLATEGAFFLRYLGMLEMTPEDWTTILTDIRATLLPATKGTNS